MTSMTEDCLLCSVERFSSNIRATGRQVAWPTSASLMQQVGGKRR